MAAGIDEDPKDKPSRLGDYFWIFFFVGLGIFLIFMAMLLLEIWPTSALNRQLFGR